MQPQQQFVGINAVLPLDCLCITGQIAEILVASAVEEMGPPLTLCVNDQDLFVGDPGWSS